MYIGPTSKGGCFLYYYFLYVYGNPCVAKKFISLEIWQAAKCAELDTRTFACCMQDAKQRIVYYMC